MPSIYGRGATLISPGRPQPGLGDITIPDTGADLRDPFTESLLNPPDIFGDVRGAVGEPVPGLTDAQIRRIRDDAIAAARVAANESRRNVARTLGTDSPEFSVFSEEAALAAESRGTALAAGLERDVVQQRGINALAQRGQQIAVAGLSAQQQQAVASSILSLLGLGQQRDIAGAELGQRGDIAERGFDLQEQQMQSQDLMAILAMATQNPAAFSEPGSIGGGYSSTPMGAQWESSLQFIQGLVGQLGF